MMKKTSEVIKKVEDVKHCPIEVKRRLLNRNRNLIMRAVKMHTSTLNRQHQTDLAKTTVRYTALLRSRWLKVNAKWESNLKRRRLGGQSTIKGWDSETVPRRTTCPLNQMKPANIHLWAFHCLAFMSALTVLPTRSFRLRQAAPFKNKYIYKRSSLHPPPGWPVHAGR